MTTGQAHTLVHMTLVHGGPGYCRSTMSLAVLQMKMNVVAQQMQHPAPRPALGQQATQRGMYLQVLLLPHAASTSARLQVSQHIKHLIQ